MALRINHWRTDTPPASTIAWVYYLTTWILAQWDGRSWVTIDDRRVLVGVTHWLPKDAALG